MPRPRKNPGDPMDCSKRSTNPFQTYINHVIKKQPEKIQLLLAKALQNEDMLMDFNGQVHANECVFSYPDSNWYSVYLLNENGEKYFGEKGAQKFYFQMDFQMNKDDIVVDAFPTNGTFDTPDELMVNGVEMKNCVVKENGKCGNPVSKKKKKKSSAIAEGLEDSDEEDTETPEAVLEGLASIPSVGPGKTKMPRDYFEGLGSKSLIIDWMIANMKPGEIFKCIQRGSLSAEDVQQAQQLLGEGGIGPQPGPSGVSQSEINAMIQSFTPGEINAMVKIVTKEELVAAVSRKKGDNKKESIVTLCKRAGVKGYSLKQGKKGLLIVDSDGEQVDSIDEVLDECAAKESARINKLLKQQGMAEGMIQQLVSKEALIDYKGGDVPIPFLLRKAVKYHFPLIKDFENRSGELYGKIPSVRENGTLYYFKIGDILGDDLAKLDKKMKAGTVSFGLKRKFSFGISKRKQSKQKSIRILKRDLRKVSKK